MTRDNWFGKLTAGLEKDFDYRLERLILNLTEDICLRMKALSMNRSRLADKLGVSPAAVTKILDGNSNFTLRTLLSLSDALDADLKIEFGIKTMNTFVTTSGFKITAVPESHFYESGDAEPDYYRHKERQNVIPFCYHAGAGADYTTSASAV